MTWEEAESIIRQEAERTAAQICAQEHTEPQELTEAQELRRMLYNALNAYREADSGAPSRRYVDRLLQRSRVAAEHSRQDKKLHNIAVMQYIAAPAPTEQERKRMFAFNTFGMLHEAERKAFDRLAVLAFGFCGYDFPLASAPTGKERRHFARIQADEKSGVFPL